MIYLHDTEWQLKYPEFYENKIDIFIIVNNDGPGMHNYISFKTKAKNQLNGNAQISPTLSMGNIPKII